MYDNEKPYSPIASIFRNTQKVETLIRIHNVTGQTFPVSGNAWLRRQQQLETANRNLARLKYTYPCDDCGGDTFHHTDNCINN